MRQWLEHVQPILDFELFSLGGNVFSLGRLLYLLGLVALLIFVSRQVRRLVTSRLTKRGGVHPGVRQSIAMLAQYALVAMGLAVILSTAGLDLSAFTVVGATLGIGVGFGLQHLVNNLVAGLVILLERPVKVGDRIEVGDVHGKVIAIAARATTIRTNDAVTIIVPNSAFITETVINWSHDDDLRRFSIPVGVAYREDPERVRDILIEVARSHPGVETEPAPDVWFASYGDSALQLELFVWTRSYTDRPGRLRSELYYAIFRRFRAEGVEIPYPQRDLHIRSGAVQHEADAPNDT